MKTASISHALARCSVLAWALLGAATVQASVVINNTRIIYPQDDKEVTVRLESKNQAPVLIQIWLDNGDEHSTPDLAGIPFILTPPIFRIEPGKQQVVRLAYSGDALPSTQERLFWFNLLEVPSQSQGTPQRNQLQLAFRSRIKLFFRPTNLPYTAAAAPRKLQWRHVSSEQGQALEVYNPSPYHVTFEQVELHLAGQHHPRKPATSGAENMVTPGGRKRFELPSLKTRPSTTATLEFQTLDDFGVKVSHSTEISP